MSERNKHTQTITCRVRIDARTRELKNCADQRAKYAIEGLQAQKVGCVMSEEGPCQLYENPEQGKACFKVVTIRWPLEKPGK